jgi:hypothetical protein
MHDGDVRITLEVVEVEAEDPIHSMNAHRSDDSGIMDLDS